MCHWTLCWSELFLQKWTDTHAHTDDTKSHSRLNQCLYCDCRTDPYIESFRFNQSVFLHPFHAHCQTSKIHSKWTFKSDAADSVLSIKWKWNWFWWEGLTDAIMTSHIHVLQPWQPKRSAQPCTLYPLCISYW